MDFKILLFWKGEKILQRIDIPKAVPMKEGNMLAYGIFM